mmetsp:Transcript_25757/g.81794  ORF Transcript_25757/g.81794 Transcript_25757/m.81794 type:complete len:147 (-) Transcript_25757:107-547(-)
MALRVAIAALVVGLAAPAAAYVPAASGAPRAQHVVRVPEQALPRTIASRSAAASEASAEEPSGLILAALSCAAGAAFGWVNSRRRQVAASAAAAAAGASPLAAGAADASSVTLALDPLQNPDLGFIFLTSLTSMSIALVVWGRNGL